MRPFRFSLAVLPALAACFAGPSSRADDSLPKAQPVARYEAMATRSPFTAPTVALPTPVPAAAPAGPHWWDQMAVTSLMELGGTYFAAVVDRANSKRYVLERGKPDEDSHLLLTEVQWNERAELSTVIVRKGTEIAPPLRFDTTAVPPAATGPQQPFNAPRNAGAFTPPTLPPGFSGTPPPPPPSTSVVRRGGPIQSRPSGPQYPGSATQPVPPNAPEVRKVRPLGGNTEADD